MSGGSKGTQSSGGEQLYTASGTPYSGPLPGSQTGKLPASSMSNPAIKVLSMLPVGSSLVGSLVEGSTPPLYTKNELGYLVPYTGGAGSAMAPNPTAQNPAELQARGVQAATQYQARQEATQQQLAQALAAAQTPQNTAGQLSQIFSMGAGSGVPTFQPMRSPYGVPVASSPVPTALDSEGGSQ